MNVLRKTLMILLLSSTTVMAAPASDDSIKQLFAVTQVQKLLDGMQNKLDAMMNHSLQQALKGKTPNPDEQQAISNMKNKMVALFQEEMAWETLEPMYIRIYKESFTEEEVIDILSFYKTPAGQALINKMPILMQKTMLELQARLSGLTPKLHKIQQEFVSEITAKK